MGRCKKERCCRRLGDEIVFKPIQVPFHEAEIMEIEADEFEALRLCDMENKSQIEAGKIMQVSRGTIQRLINSGRSKIMQALLHKKIIKVNSDNNQKEKSL